MKENVLDVLMYLFENYMDEGGDFHPDQDVLATELSQAGFPRGEIKKAFLWLEELASLRGNSAGAIVGGGPASVRHYSELEQRRLTRDMRGFLMFLEQRRILNSFTRELVIDRVMALETEEIDIEQLKWIILMVLFNQPGHEHAYAWMEDLVFNDEPVALH